MHYVRFQRKYSELQSSTERLYCAAGSAEFLYGSSETGTVPEAGSVPEAGAVPGECNAKETRAQSEIAARDLRLEFQMATE